VRSLRPAELFPDALRINLNVFGTEYLLVENRQPVQYDALMPAGADGHKGGLIVWHVDEAKVWRNGATVRCGSSLVSSHRISAQSRSA
jgi:hypothetical protein